MQVMDNTEFESKEVLIGQRGKVVAAEVSDDAGLMSMLSTGLYKYPLRTMLQEIMFNAWDAHRMGNCQDKPFDIYLNEQSGLIVRDYGPGIAPDMIGPIYLTYGNSTKRDDTGSTGGFGLGSKSPFAYTDSFMVTSCHKGMRSMYSIMKVCEDANGKPGSIPLISDVPTDETGLTVTVPMKSNNDRIRAYEFIKEISHLSGMKFNLHFSTGAETQTEKFICDSISPGEFVCVGGDNNIPHHGSSRGLFAVYGGVTYDIENDPEYEEEYRFLDRLSCAVGAIYVGFAPNTLTPLPSREGLNFSDKTKENIQGAIEVIQEQMKNMLKPALNKAMKFTLDHLMSLGLDEEYVTYHWRLISEGSIPLTRGLYLYTFEGNLTGNTSPRRFYQSLEFQKLQDECPKAFNKTVWKSLIYLAFTNTRSICELAGIDERVQMARLHYLRFRNPSARNFILHSYRKKNVRHTDVPITNYIQERREASYKALIDARDGLSELLGKPHDIRILKNAHERWTVAKNIRSAGKVNTGKMNPRQETIFKALSSKKKIELPNRPFPDRLWSSHTGKEFDGHIFPKVILLAKTITAMNETHVYSETVFYRDCKPEIQHCLRNKISQFFNQAYEFQQVPGIVVHDKKGNFQKAVDYFNAMGWHVIIGEEPVKKESVLPLEEAKVIAKPKPKAEWPLIAAYSHQWEDFSCDPIPDPEVFIHLTKKDFDRHWREDSKPSKALVQAVQALKPKLVRLDNKIQEGTIRKAGAISFPEFLDQKVDKLLKNPDRLCQLYTYYILSEDGSFPKELLALPEMQKRLGLKYVRTSQKENFDKDLDFLCQFLNSKTNYKLEDHIWTTTREKLKNALDLISKKPDFAATQQAIKMSAVFNKDKLRGMVSKKRGENKVLVEKILRFLKTV